MMWANNPTHIGVRRSDSTYHTIPKISDIVCLYSYLRGDTSSDSECASCMHSRFIIPLVNTVRVSANCFLLTADGYISLVQLSDQLSLHCHREKMKARAGRYFPEIIDEQSSHLNLSPLTGVIQDLRRKNVVTAAAAAGPQMPLLDSSDPWGSSESLGVAGDSGGRPGYGSPCMCQFRPGSRRRTSWTGLRYGSRRASLGYSSPPRTPSNPRRLSNRESVGSDSSGREDSICPECGRVRNGAQDIRHDGGNGFPSRSPRQVRLSSWLDSTRIERLESPQHAEALLVATPQLRLISQASTDMQGAGGASSKGLFGLILPVAGSNGSGGSDVNGSRSKASDYRASLIRDRANQQAAAELSSLLWILAHEMSLEDYGTVESEVFTAVFALVHSQTNERRMAGLSALDALIDAPSADEEKKAIKFANTLSNGLRSAHGDYEFLSAVSKALGHMATRTVNVDFVEAEVVRALEWLRTDRSDRRYVRIGLYSRTKHQPRLTISLINTFSQIGCLFVIEGICSPCTYNILLEDKPSDTGPRRFQ